MKRWVNQRHQCLGVKVGLFCFLALLLAAPSFASGPCSSNARKGDTMAEVQEKCGPPSAVYVENDPGIAVGGGVVMVNSHTVWAYENERGKTVLRVKFNKSKAVSVRR